MIRKCKKHATQMRIRKSNDRKSGIKWECPTCNAESQRKYRNTSHGFMKRYLIKRDSQLKSMRLKAEEQLKEIQKERREIELAIK